MDFKERLRQYRLEQGINTKQEMADKLGVSGSVYREAELGSRKPSKNLIRSLVAYSGKTEEYWLYGAVKLDELNKVREEYKSTRATVEELIEGGYIKDVNFSENIEKILITSLKADIQHILLKKGKVVD